MARRGDGILLKGRTWYLDCRIGGKRFQKRLGKGISRKIAAELASVLRGSILRDEAGIGKKAKDLSFAEASKKFTAWMQTDKKLNTVRAYAACLRQLEKTFGSKRLSEITPWTVDLFKQRRTAGVTLTERPNNLTDIDWARRCRQALAGAPVRVNRELAVLKMLFNRCRDWNLYEGENPVCRIKFRREPRQRLRFLEPEEEHKLLEMCSEPVKTLVLIGSHCGLRIQAEALTLRWENVDLKRGTLSVEAAYSKNGRMRMIPLNTVMRAALANLQKTAKGDFVFARDDGKPFRSVKTVFSTACRKAGLSGISLHTLRHTFASRLVMSGADLKTVMELGGWSSLEMIQRYAHLSEGHKSEAIEKIGVEFTYRIPHREKSTLTVAS